MLFFSFSCYSNKLFKKKLYNNINNTKINIITITNNNQTYTTSTTTTNNNSLIL